MRRLLPCLLVLLVPLAACGGDGGGDSTADASRSTAKTTEEPSPSALREALEDTTTKPVIPKPAGSPPRRLVREDVVKGEGPGAKRGDTLVVNYVGVAFSTGKEFDSSWDRGQPLSVVLGAHDVIGGWERGLVGMRKGGRRILTIPPELAYGSQGYPPAIAPNETLIFVVDAVSISPRS